MILGKKLGILRTSFLTCSLNLLGSLSSFSTQLYDDEFVLLIRKGFFWDQDSNRRIRARLTTARTRLSVSPPSATSRFNFHRPSSDGENAVLKHLSRPKRQIRSSHGLPYLIMSRNSGRPGQQTIQRMKNETLVYTQGTKNYLYSDLFLIYTSKSNQTIIETFHL